MRYKRGGAEQRSFAEGRLEGKTRKRKEMTENELTAAIIGSAIEVHRRLGPGLLETVYRRCLAYELRKKGFDVIEEKPIPLDYDDLHDPCAFRADLLVNGLVVVELKAKATIHPIDKYPRNLPRQLWYDHILS
jgi:GxxExxY protein